ncbi:MAG: TrkH family potassium uptake protein [Pseudomonadales bacterium]|jgi:trk system potassium uptake protein TrkH|nr:TrkH family potassium uptake protein [Gammaproteobacteria bacterium]MBP6050690.1 TrkH family potassium uptake protein [Pseudomonadales bacterium]MBK6585505.1 TrkH family potassium uptake protein [Gammaproteobacteria bacterium]MBK7168846.1 TrkH family potassium uptake protein [Gammaproteobacteria bacterium]MBK7521001.1 TrkH family potassium uptake protein [Gammaproteobacteria bacterium]
MSGGPATLARPVRARVLARFGGQLLLVGAVMNGAPLLVALFFGEWSSALVQSLIVLAFCGLGIVLHRSGIDGELQRNEALVLVALAFVITPALSSLAFVANGMPITDALFEAVSGISTTGLSMIADPGAYPATFLFTRAWLQWYGGLGVIVLGIALLGGQDTATRRLYSPLDDRLLLNSSRRFARNMLRAYVLLSLGAWAVLSLTGTDPFDALLHTLSAVSTGGFSPYADSLRHMPGWGSRYLVIAFSLIGALPLALVIERGLRQAGGDGEIRALLALCLAWALLLAWRMHQNLGIDWPEALLQGGLLGISAQSTTGFSVLAPLQLDDISKLLLCLSMLSGGCLGSTAGGIKLLRILILLRVLQVYFLRSAMPRHAVVPHKLGGALLSGDEIQHALILLLLFVLVLLGSWLVFVACGYPAVDSLFEVSSALATTGLSVGISSTALPTGLKLLLCFDMLLGRVEVFALLVLLYPRTWILRR